MEMFVWSYVLRRLFLPPGPISDIEKMWPLDHPFNELRRTEVSLTF